MITEHEPPVLLEKTLEGFDISPVSSAVLDSVVRFANGTEPLSLKSALLLSPQQLVDRSLQVLKSREEAVVREKKHQRNRPSSEATQIRVQYQRMRSTLLNEGPGTILAAVAANPGKEAKWEMNGLVGNNEEWIEPNREEREWWRWVYGQRQKGEKIEGWFVNEEGLNIAHGFFIMRARARRDAKDERRLSDFIDAIGTFLPEDPESSNLTPLLRKVSQYFN